MDPQRPSLVKSKSKWVSAIRKGVEADAWGQVVEALELYGRASVRLLGLQEEDGVDVEARAELAKIYLCVQLRVKALEQGETQGKDDLPLREMQALVPYLEDVFEGAGVAFPVDLTAYQAARTNSDGTLMSTRAEKELEGGFLLPPPAPFPGGGTAVSILIERIDLADARTYLEPRIVISVVDGSGKLLESAQETPFAGERTDTAVVFGNTVEIQSNVDVLPPGATIFLEFKHYKARKNKVSTRCFALIEPDEFGAAGELLLELYKKPADFARKKKLKLFSASQYMHVRLTLRRDPA